MRESKRVALARKVLAERAKLTDLDDAEPQIDDETATQAEGRQWLGWHAGWAKQYARLQSALAALADELGEDVPSHPINYVPFCKAIIDG